VDKYSWVDLGSSYLPSDIQAAFLWAQLEKADEINQNRLQIWRGYRSTLESLVKTGCISIPFIPDSCEHNAHMFYLKVSNLEVRTALLEYLKTKDVNAVFHYIPLHSSVAGQQFSRFNGQDIYTTKESERLLRLPIYYGLDIEKQNQVTTSVLNFFK
jgi:dTDP-4-amino-4,6-dideoxygalactose transaminase